MTERGTEDVAQGRIVGITLDEHTVVRRTPDIEQERAAAIFDLLEENSFQPDGVAPGSYHLHLTVEDGRLVFNVETQERTPLTKTALPLASFRGIVRDYFLICESYYNAIKQLSPSQIETIDMGRRGLHDEAAALLMERLAGKIAIDKNTARRLFTLVCVLHIR